MIMDERCVFTHLTVYTDGAFRVRRPNPYCWSEALAACIGSRGNRHTTMSIKHGCMCSNFTACLQMPFLQRHYEEWCPNCLHTTRLASRAHAEDDANRLHFMCFALMHCCSPPTPSSSMSASIDTPNSCNLCVQQSRWWYPDVAFDEPFGEIKRRRPPGRHRFSLMLRYMTVISKDLTGMLRTDCSGETTLALHVPSSSRARNRKHSGHNCWMLPVD